MLAKFRFYVFTFLLTASLLSGIIASIEARVIAARGETIDALQKQLGELQIRTDALEKSIGVYIKRKEIVKYAAKNFADSVTDRSWLSEPCPVTFTELYNAATAKIFGTCDVEGSL